MNGVEVVIALLMIVSVALGGWLLLDELLFRYQRRQFDRARSVTSLAESVGVLPPDTEA